jgi:hypothetical protein
MFALAALLWWFLHSPILPPALYLAGVWCCVTGAVKLVMLLRSDGSAERLMKRLLKRRNAPLRPARVRRFRFF